MEKLEFIARQLSKAQTKRYEHYVVQRIWHRLDRLDLKMITQQFVSRPNREPRRAMTDMYFPQLGLHIEIDEPHHLKYVAADQLREADIINATGHKFIRVPVSNDIMSFNQLIDGAIDQIRTAVESTEFKEWNPLAEMSPATYIKKGYIHVDEDVAFRTMADAASCFGRTYAGLQRSFIPHPTEAAKFLWFPKLYENAQWRNTLSSDEEVIKEICKIPDLREFQVDGNIRDFERNGRRLVFARVKSPLGDLMYRFKGEYLLDVGASDYEQGTVFNRVDKRALTYDPRKRVEYRS
ncbi:MAG: AbaSI family restriction endonuclease [Pyrinomonadaceae bacterium]